MKILSIASGLRVPKIHENENDVVFEFYSQYLAQHPSDSVEIIQPNIYVPRLLRSLSKQWNTLYEINQLGSFEYRKLKVEVFPYFGKRKNPLLNTLLAQSITLINQKQIQNLINASKVDVIHAQHIFPDSLLAAYISKKAGIPFVTTARRELYAMKKPLIKNCSDAVLHKASSITTVNPQMHKLLTTNGFNSEFIPHGIDNIFFEKKKPKTQAPFKLLTVTRLLDIKHIDKVLLALHGMLNSHDFTYTIVGTGPEEERLKKLAHTLGLEKRVTFTGKLPYKEIPGILANHDVFVMPSYPEIFGRVYYEAMAVGLPVIGAINSGIHGLLADDNYALFADHNNVADIASKIVSLLENEALRVDITTKAKTLVSDSSWSNIANKYHAIYSRAIAENYKPK